MTQLAIMELNPSVAVHDNRGIGAQLQCNALQSCLRADTFTDVWATGERNDIEAGGGDPTNYRR